MISELAFLLESFLKLGHVDGRQVFRAMLATHVLRLLKRSKAGKGIHGQDDLLMVSKAGTKMATITIMMISVVRMEPLSNPRV